MKEHERDHFTKLVEPSAADSSFTCGYSPESEEFGESHFAKRVKIEVNQDGEKKTLDIDLHVNQDQIYTLPLEIQSLLSDIKYMSQMQGTIMESILSKTSSIDCFHEVYESIEKKITEYSVSKTEGNTEIMGDFTPSLSEIYPIVPEFSESLSLASCSEMRSRGESLSQLPKEESQSFAFEDEQQQVPLSLASSKKMVYDSTTVINYEELGFEMFPLKSFDKMEESL